MGETAGNIETTESKEPQHIVVEVVEIGETKLELSYERRKTPEGIDQYVVKPWVVFLPKETRNILIKKIFDHIKSTKQNPYIDSPEWIVGAMNMDTVNFEKMKGKYHASSEHINFGYGQYFRNSDMPEDLKLKLNRSDQNTEVTTVSNGEIQEIAVSLSPETIDKLRDSIYDDPIGRKILDQLKNLIEQKRPLQKDQAEPLAKFILEKTLRQLHAPSQGFYAENFHGVMEFPGYFFAYGGRMSGKSYKKGEFQLLAFDPQHIFSDDLRSGASGERSEKYGHFVLKEDIPLTEAVPALITFEGTAQAVQNFEQAIEASGIMPWSKIQYGLVEPRVIERVLQYFMEPKEEMPPGEEQSIILGILLSSVVDPNFRQQFEFSDIYQNPETVQALRLIAQRILSEQSPVYTPINQAEETFLQTFQQKYSEKTPSK